MTAPAPRLAWVGTGIAGLGLVGAAAHSSAGLAWHVRATAIGFASGFAGGLVAGAIGLIAIPLIVLGLGLPIHQAAATNLAQTAATAGFGAWRHLRLGLVDLRNAALVLAGSVVGAPAGSWLALRLPSAQLTWLFVSALVAAAAWTALRAVRTTKPRVRGPAHRNRVAPLLGLGLGLASGLLGVGAGFLVTPSLAGALQLPLHVAIGTGLAVISGNSLLAGLPYAGQVQWLAAGFLALGGSVGVRLGARLGRRTDERLLRAGLAAVLLAAAWSLAP